MRMRKMTKKWMAPELTEYFSFRCKANIFEANYVPVQAAMWRRGNLIQLEIVSRLFKNPQGRVSQSMLL
jgi:hypothetical protein